MKRDDEHDRTTYLAWRTAHLSGLKRLPDLKTLLTKTLTVERQSATQHMTALQMLGFKGVRRSHG